MCGIISFFSIVVPYVVVVRRQKDRYLFDLYEKTTKYYTFDSTYIFNAK